MTRWWQPGKADKRVVAGLVVAALVLGSVSASLWSGADREVVGDARTVRYVYDDVGRLLAVSDPSTDTAVYRYDPVGNVVAIARWPSAALSVIAVSPAEAAAGDEVTVHGTGFDADAGGNGVRFGDAWGEVLEAGEGTLTVKVPPEARSGAVAVTVGDEVAASPGGFTVVPRGPPLITSVTPEVVSAGDEVRIAGEGLPGPGTTPFTARVVHPGGGAPNTAPPLFSQTTASRTFRHGPFADQSIGDVAGGLRAGKISPAELLVDVIVRDGETIGLNTRSMLALRRGGIDPSDWTLNDVTGVPGMERLLTERLLRNQLTGGTDVLRITGAGPYASSLR